MRKRSTALANVDLCRLGHGRVLGLAHVVRALTDWQEFRELDSAILRSIVAHRAVRP